MTINVEDTTEPPTIAAQSVTVREDAAVGSRVLAVVVQDEDAGDTHTCTITEGNIGSMFALKPVSGSTSSFHCEVIVGTGGLDFEKASKVVLKVTAADSADPPNSGSGLVTVSVTDVNEAPVITDSSAGRAVSALALKGSPSGAPWLSATPMWASLTHGKSCPSPRRMTF
ncbi:MAG: cadherin repeat domain-containing protein, partial [Propionibacteriaceae bacterium]|nr:cadherin repeat domain-containing protein [Propionibacteriaceae bacterium]